MSGLARGLAKRFRVTNVDLPGHGMAPVPTHAMGVPEHADLVASLIREHFDLRPYGILNMLDLIRPIYRQTAAYGHFGREDIDLSWERTDKAEALKAAAS